MLRRRFLRLQCRILRTDHCHFQVRASRVRARHGLITDEEDRLCRGSEAILCVWHIQSACRHSRLNVLLFIFNGTSGCYTVIQNNSSTRLRINSASSNQCREESLERDANARRRLVRAYEMLQLPEGQAQRKRLARLKSHLMNPSAEKVVQAMLPLNASGSPGQQQSVQGFVFFVEPTHPE